MEIKEEIKVIRYIEYDGIRFYCDKKGYWISSKIKCINVPKRLHIYVWEKYNGNIPEGYHVHHIDHNTDNNEISNLQLIEGKEHLKYHGQLESNKANSRINIEIARPYAIEWHKSNDGIEWHKKHYKNMEHKLHTRLDIKCIVCGKEVNVGRGGVGNKFCSNNCKSAYRRLSGVDNITLKCGYCGGDYVTNKYSQAKYCSNECRWKKINESKGN